MADSDDEDPIEDQKESDDDFDPAAKRLEKMKKKILGGKKKNKIKQTPNNLIEVANKGCCANILLKTWGEFPLLCLSLFASYCSLWCAFSACL